MSELIKIWGEPENRGILAVLFPGLRVLKEPFPMFLPQTSVILVTERDVDFYNGKSIIQVTRRAERKMEHRPDLLSVLKERGVICTPSQEEALLAMDDDEFMKHSKVAAILGKFHTPGIEVSSSIFRLFARMFSSYDEGFKHYRLSGQPHKLVFSALLTMMLKTQNLDAPGLSPGYKKVLMENRPYYLTYKGAVATYLETPTEERDFLSFLAALSLPKRGGEIAD